MNSELVIRTSVLGHITSNRSVRTRSNLYHDFCGDLIYYQDTKTSPFLRSEITDERVGRISSEEAVKKIDISGQA